MPRGSKAKYTNKQKRMAAHIEEGEEKRGHSKKVAQRIAWATVNKETGALPTWPYSRGWGYYPSGIGGILLIILIILLLLGYL